MLRIRDLYTYVDYPPLEPSGGKPFGTATIQYEVRLYQDVRNGTYVRGFIVTCTQRLMIPNPNPYSMSAGPASFTNYPALISSSISIAPQPVQQIQLLDYSPKTLNSSVQTDQSSSDGSSVSSSQQSTTGSSTATTNTYGASASVGVMGDAPTASVSGSYEHSSMNTSYSDQTTGSASSHDTQLSNTSDMTIKNWGSYAQLSPDCSSSTWIWGQEYPWNVIQLKNTAPHSNIIILPPAVQNRLFDGQPFPPSELSVFGVNFVSKASWLVIPSATAGPIYLDGTHTIRYIAASHGANATGEFSASFSQSSLATYYLPQDQLDLELYALDPIGIGDPAGSGVIGFVPNKFVVAPNGGGAFKITSDSNNLHARGEGFETVMSTSFPEGMTVFLMVYFKIVDTHSDVNLYLKHWKTTNKACVLTISVNGGQGIITKHVDTLEEEGGSNSFTTISLRYKDFASIDYCDYLMLGLNTIEITIAPSQDGDPAATAGYALSAISIG